MLLEFYGVVAGEKELRKLFKTTPLHGTYWKFVSEGMDKFNVKFVYLKNQNLQNIENLIENNTPLVVSIDSSVVGGKDETNHVVVVVGIEDNLIIVHDTETGANIKINDSDFLTAWRKRDSRIGYIKPISNRVK